MGTTNRSVEYMGFNNIINLSNGLKMSKVLLHLDHGDYKNSVKCINKGYNSVMFDGSEFSLKKNIRLTKKIVRLAHKYGVIVEGEVGTLERDGLTDPDEALRFVQQTSVDMLAVSVGNLHGYYKYMPVIDFKRLKDIHESVRIPLVLHGASGLKPSDIKRSVKLGVSKVNYDTDLRWAFSYEVNNFVRRHSMSRLNTKSFDIRNYLSPARQAFMNKVVEKIKILG
jgi:ketose-bisphosphate aldolase